jgi:integrase
MKITHVPSKKYTPYMVRFPGGQRRFFKTEDDATTAIREHTQGKAKVVLSKRLVDEVLYCKSLLGETPLLTATRFYLEHHHAIDGSATLGPTCDLYWSAVNVETASPYYTDKVRQHLANVKKGLGIETPLTAVGSLRYQAFIQSLPTLPQQHAHHRTCRGLFKFATDRHLMAKNPTNGWKPATLPKKRPVYLSVDSTALLLDWLWLRCPRLIPAFALQLFCGIRTAELARKPTKYKRPLDWKDINFESRRIDIADEVAKGTQKSSNRRVIDWWPDCLTHWLLPFRQESGPVCCADYDHLKSKKLRECREELKLDGITLGFGQNAFRHSFATYGVAFFQSAERIALLMGHRGSDMLFRHYRDYTSQEEARLFFSIKPSAPLLLKLIANALPDTLPFDPEDYEEIEDDITPQMAQQDTPQAPARLQGAA